MRQRSSRRLNSVSFKSRIGVYGLKLDLKIGWGEEERSKPQPIFFDLELGLPHRAGEGDNLENTVCYDQASQILHRTATSQEFRLLEALAEAVYQDLKTWLGSRAQLRLRVWKKHPPLQWESAGTSYQLGDWDEAWLSSH